MVILYKTGFSFNIVIVSNITKYHKIGYKSRQALLFKELALTVVRLNTILRYIVGK